MPTMRAHHPTEGLSFAPQRHRLVWLQEVVFMDDHATRTALFRYGVIAPLLAPDLEPEEKRLIREGILAQTHVFPGEAKARKASARTIRRWLRAYRQGGFSGLKPKQRRDRGRPKSIGPEVLEKAVALREEVPSRSTRQIIDILVLDPETPVGPGHISPSTLARHFSRLGKTRRLLGKPKVSFRRYEKDRPNAQWQSDVWYGPHIPDPRSPDKKRRVYLIGFMDDHSRLVTHAQFYPAEDLPSLLDCFKKAIQKRGLPTRLYCDNGIIYTSRQFSRIVAELGIHHIHAKAYAPEGKGKIERFWQVVESSFVSELKTRPAESLEELNTLFSAWLEQGYHHWVNRETGEKPVTRFGRGLAELRLPDPVPLGEVFLWKDRRRVDKTGLLSLDGNRYEVDPRLAQRRVQVRYDPFDLTEIQVWADGRRFDAKPYELVRERDRRVKAPEDDSVTLPVKTGLSYLDLLRSTRTRPEAPSGVSPSTRRGQESSGVSPSTRRGQERMMPKMFESYYGLSSTPFTRAVAPAARVTLRFHLTGLPEKETRAYIEHHLKTAGLSHALFSDEAAGLIHQFTKASPGGSTTWLPSASWRASSSRNPSLTRAR